MILLVDVKNDSGFEMESIPSKPRWDVSNFSQVFFFYLSIFPYQLPSWVCIPGWGIFVCVLQGFAGIHDSLSWKVDLKYHPSLWRVARSHEGNMSIFYLSPTERALSKWVQCCFFFFSLSLSLSLSLFFLHFFLHFFLSFIGSLDGC